MRKSRNNQKGSDYYKSWYLEQKLTVLSKYSPNNALQCSWPGCQEKDIDVLSLDHINNDGAEKRRAGEGSGTQFYLRLKRADYPSGYQTLCMNHQTKKEVLRRRHKPYSPRKK